MKKVFFIFGLLLTVSLATFSQDNKAEEGVVINGVKWATRNVDAPGTFAAKPEDTGMFYQYNRNIAWATAGEVPGWDTYLPEGIVWEKANDPSPAGWRVPTFDEIKTLLVLDKVDNEWTTENGINGCKFTDKSTGNSIFLPAAGFRFYLGTLTHQGTFGYYWCDSQVGGQRSYYLIFNMGSVNWNYLDRRSGLCIRSVVE